jgi:hypothetical protein
MIVYVVVGVGGGIETVWTTPQAAMDAQERGATRGSGSYIAVRATDSEEPTEESLSALLALRGLQHDRHDQRAQEMLESRNLRRAQRP